MKKNKFLYLLLISFSFIGLQGCNNDIISEFTQLDVNRLFSPTDIEARVVNQTSVRVNWKEVTNAQTYEIEVYLSKDVNVSGNPELTIKDLTTEDRPFTIPDLLGETDYVIRLKAKGNNLSDSKWTPVLIKTDAEQIFKAVDLADIKATSVILKWPANQKADQIILMPGNIVHAVTSSEISEGAATITGLLSETKYSAKLMLRGATRGTTTFTTLLDLGGAIAINPGDDITTIFQNANEGDIFALLPGTYPSKDIVISKSVSIKGARPASKPILSGTIFRIEGGASLELKDLILNGAGSLDGNQTFIYAAGSYPKLSIEGCEISNYIKGALYINNATLIESVSIRNSIYSNIECNGGDFIDFRQGLSKSFSFENNTVYNSALARDFFRMDAGGSTNFPDVKSIITIKNNTFNNISNGSNRRVLYVRLASHEITFEKNIISNTDGYFSNQPTTNVVKWDKNNYFNAPNFTGSTQSNAKNDNSGTQLTLNPGYKNSATGDFTISNEELKFLGIGDKRWIK